MDLDLSPEQQQFQKVVRDFADHELRPHVGDWDQRHELPMEAVGQMARLGLFGLPFPEEYGGSGADFLTLCLAIEEVARVDASLAITLEAAVGLGAMPIARFGTEEQKQKWLPALASGEALGGFGLTEPGGGSDAGATRTTAVLKDGRWVINGSKSFITNSGTPITSFVTVTAVSANDNGSKEISAIIVPSGTPGFSVSKSYRKMGWWHSDTHELAFTDCQVPGEHLLGARGAGFRNFLEILDDGRIAISAMAVGIAQGCLEECLAYVADRQAFGRPIGGYQAIAFKLADMATRVELARQAYHRAAWLKAQGRPYKKEAAMAKLFSSEIAVDTTREAVQIHGGYGYMEEYPVCRAYRDAKILEIGEGTSEIMRIVIARELGLPI